MGDFPIIVTRQSQTINREDMEEQHNSRENMGAIYGKEVKRDPINDITAYDDSNLTVTHDNLFTDDYVNFLEDISPDILQNIGYSRITQINFIRQTQNNDGNTLYKPFQIMPISMGNMSGGGMSITSMTGAGIVSYPEPHGDGDESYIERYYEVLQGKFPTEPGEAIIYVDNNGRIPLNTLTTLGFDVKDGEKITFDEVLDAKLVVAGNDDYYIKNGQMYSELNSYAQMQTANEMVNNYIASVRTMGVDPAWLGISEEDPVAWFYGLSASENPEEDMASAFENAAKKYGEKLGADIAAGTLVMNPADVPAKVTDTMNKVGTGMEDMQKNFTSDAYQEKVDEKIQELAETAYKADNTVEVKIVGVVALRTDAAMSILSPGIAFPDSFVNEVISNAQESSIVKAQKGNPDVNVLTGKNFNADQSMLDQLTGGSSLDYDTVMQLIGGESKPMIFTLFPLDFESKEKLIKKLDKFNSDTALERYRQDFIDAGVKEEDVPTKAKDFNENFLELLEDNYASLIKNNEDGVIDEVDGKLLQNKQFIVVTQKDGGRWRSPFVTDMYSVVYTDLSGSIMDMTDGIMDTITVVLIGFAGISLVVTLIMIAIITYTSVLERIKEIGVLRALGARKKDIIRVFDAETFWIGAFSGILGIAIAYVLIFPMNIIIENITDVPDVAVLNPIHAVCLFIISTLLTVAGGHIPAMKASKMNAVEALRSE
jgi:ABC-type antimicrobial peptide transport system permease subunit